MIFQAHVEVPDSVIRKIAMDIKDKMFHEMLNKPEFDYTSKGCRNWALGQLFNEVVEKYITDNVPSYQGFTLTTTVAKVIAHYIHNYKKIDAIKEFRSHTDTGLKEAKFLIDEFEMGPHGSAKFLAAFT